MLVTPATVPVEPVGSCSLWQRPLSRLQIVTRTVCFLCGVSDRNTKGNNPFIYCCQLGNWKARGLSVGLSFSMCHWGGHLPRLGGVGFPARGGGRLSRALRPQSQHSSRLCLLVAVCAHLSPSFQVSGCLVDGFLKIGVGVNFLHDHLKWS